MTLELRSIIKSMLPLRTLDRAKEAHRQRVFRRAMRRFEKAPETCTEPGNSVVSDLIYGWGNESWSALDEYLASCIDHALNANGHILECGSGLSTVLVGTIAQQRGIEHWALEHSSDWGAKTRFHLDELKIDSVNLSVKPLVNYGDFVWYDAPSTSMPARFALVICDGPPAHVNGGRIGLVPVMSEKLKKGSVILLDDAARDHEREIAENWRQALGASREVLGIAAPFIKLTVRESSCRQTAPKSSANGNSAYDESAKTAFGGRYR